MNTLKLDEDSKNVILEVSALSGLAQNIVKEVLEYLAYSWAVRIVDCPDNFTPLRIPYLGEVYIKYKDDKVNTNGDIETEVETFVNLAPGFKKLIGDLHDEGYSELVPWMQKKIEQAVMVASSPSE